MTKSELIEALARRQTHLAFSDVELAVKSVIEQMSHALAQGERIEVRGFGSFALHYRPPRMGRNPKTGDAVALVMADGSEHQWGKVLAYEPPHRLVLAWQLNREFSYDPSLETTVEVTFAEKDGATIVHFEHRDLERMGADAVELFESMDGGWGMLLDLFKTAAETA